MSPNPIMLSRRHLRIKALQSLYAFFVSGNEQIVIAEKNMLKNVEKIYQLIIYQLSFLTEIVKFSQLRAEEAKKKFYPTEEDINPNTRFINNRFIGQLSNNKEFIQRRNAYKINWIDERDMVRKIFGEIKNSSEYKDYMNSPADFYENDKAIILAIFRKFVASSETLSYFYEEKDIFWSVDLEIANPLTLKIIRNFRQEFNDLYHFPPLYNLTGKDDPEEDKNFLVHLFRKTILRSSEFEKIIKEKASNWDIERIAIMDIILIKMAIVEFLEFPSIPVKVTMNEYIELSKLYSTPKSKIFINGMLDKIISDLKKDNRLIKTGRGLIE